MPSFDGPIGLQYPSALLAEARWYALRTRSRVEKRSALYLQAFGIEADAAIAEESRRWTDRTREVGKPLFPGYIFARFTLTGIALPLSCPGVVEVVRSDGVPIPLRDSEMDAVRRLAAGISRTGEAPCVPEYEEIALGTRVRVAAGPFAEMTGVLLETRGRGCVAVHIEAIRQVRAVNIDRANLTPLEDGEDRALPLTPSPSPDSGPLFQERG
jgi:transcription antitermination factor NusG